MSPGSEQGIRDQQPEGHAIVCPTIQRVPIFSRAVEPAFLASFVEPPQQQHPCLVFIMP